MLKILPWEYSASGKFFCMPRSLRLSDLVKQSDKRRLRAASLNENLNFSGHPLGDTDCVLSLHGLFLERLVGQYLL